MNVKLLVKQGRPAGKALQFGPGEYYLGRGEECHVRFNSDWVSRQHCLLVVKSERALLYDLGSRNGTLVNGQLLQQERELKDSDLVQVGPVAFEVRLEPAAVSELPMQAIVRAADADSNVSDIPLDSTAHQPALPQEPPAHSPR